MTTATHTTTTAKKREEALEALHVRLAEQVEALRLEQGWFAYLTAARLIKRYSTRNILLIISQRPGATDVATYQGWLARGRQVRRGEVHMKILAPCHARSSEAEREVAENEATSTEPGPARRISGFRPLAVFDISQTDRADGAAEPAPGPPTLDSDDDAGLYARLVAHFERTGVELHRRIIPGPTMGYTRRVAPAGAPRAAESAWVTEVVIDERSIGADAALTALHEAAHIAGGHLDSAPGDYVAHRGRYEIEAESAAYIVAGIAGLDSGPASSGYVAGYHRETGPATLEATAEATLRIARILTAALGLDEQEDPGKAAHQAQPVAA